MEAFGYMIFYLLIFIAAGYYFFFGGKEKLKRYLFERKSLAEKAEMIMKQDFSPKYARASFYIGNNYHHKMSQADWQKYCQESVDNTLDKNSQEYVDAVAPILNAIVLDKEGYYLRRGMEDLSRNLVRFQIGVNDDISLNYFIEPYKYTKHEVTQQPQAQAEQHYEVSSRGSSSSSLQQRMQAERDLRVAKQRYRDASSARVKYKGTSWESTYEAREKQAYAEMLSAQIKYDNCK